MEEISECKSHLLQSADSVLCLLRGVALHLSQFSHSITQLLAQ